jgi:hypothetical protein
MAEEKNNGNDGGKGGEETVPKSDLDALRSKLDKRFSELRKEVDESKARASAAEAKLVPSEFDVKLPDSSDDDNGLSSETKGEIEKALEAGKSAKQNLATAINYALDQSAVAKSWEVASEFDVVDDREEIETRLKTADDPKSMEQLAQEIRLELKEAQLEKGKKTSDNESDESSNRKFDEGGGKGSPNTRTELNRKIDEAKTQEELDAVYEQVQASLTRK